jgi:hypothetical protein
MNLNGMSPENKRILILGGIFVVSLIVLTGDLPSTIELLKNGC